MSFVWIQIGGLNLQRSLGKTLSSKFLFMQVFQKSINFQKGHIFTLQRTLLCTTAVASQIDIFNKFEQQNKTQNIYIFKPETYYHNPNCPTMLSGDFHCMKGIFNKAVDSVLPQKMVCSALKVVNDSMTVDGRSYKLNKNVYVVGFGKAVLGMARAVDDVLEKHIVQGVISIPEGYTKLLVDAGKTDLLLKENSKIKAYEGAENNLPDEAAHENAQKIFNLVQNLNKEDLLIVLVSGGGSALLPLPYPDISLEDEHKLVKLMSSYGASIDDLNIVRKQIEVLKGGGLAQKARPAQVLTLIMSDVIGNKLDIIASGPTVKDPTTARMCIEVFQKLGIEDKVPEGIQNFLYKESFKEKKDSDNQLHVDVLAVDNKINTVLEDWEHVQNVIVGSNEIATQTAFDVAMALDYAPLILSTSLCGEAASTGRMFAHLAVYTALSYGTLPSVSYGSSCHRTAEFDLVKAGLSKMVLSELVVLSKRAYNCGKPVCIIAGGETTVRVRGKGLGGRNQEMVIAFALEMDSIKKQGIVSEKFSFEFLSCGTDGQDGPTTASGGIVDGDFIKNCEECGVDPQAFLDNNDSFRLLSKLKNGFYHMQTGLTGTNVMDIQLLCVRYSQ